MVSGIVKQVLKYKSETQRGGTGQEGGSSLTMSELKGMMQQAVVEAMQPMQEKMDLLEARMDARETPQLEAPKTDLLRDTDRYEAAPETEAPAARTRAD